MARGVRKSNRALFFDFGKAIALTTKDVTPEALKARFAKFAIETRDGYISRGEASPNYDTFVNGRKGAPETSVTLPGPIVYRFSYWRPIIGFAIDRLIEGSPVGVGRRAGTHYRDQWKVLSNGEYFPQDKWGDIPIENDVVIVNTKPYHRKIETGFQTTKGYQLLIRTRRAVMARFSEIMSVRYVHVTIPDPYVLKGHFRRGVRAKARTKLRLDTQRGSEMKYPAIVLTMKGVR